MILVEGDCPFCNLEMFAEVLCECKLKSIQGVK